MKLVHHKSRQLKQRYGLTAYNQMNKPSIRLIDPNSGATIGPFGLSLKALVDFARTGKLRTRLRCSNDVPAILPSAYRHNCGYAVIRNLEYRAVPRKVPVRPLVHPGICIVQFSFGRNQQTERTIVYAINPGICYQ